MSSFDTLCNTRIIKMVSLDPDYSSACFDVQNVLAKWLSAYLLWPLGHMDPCFAAPADVGSHLQSRHYQAAIWNHNVKPHVVHKCASV